MPQETVFMKFYPSGEIREVAAPSDELNRLMAAGWHQTNEKPPAAPAGEEK